MWRSNGLPHEHEIQAWDRESYQLWLRSCIRPKLQDTPIGATPPKGSSITVSMITLLALSIICPTAVAQNDLFRHNRSSILLVKALY